MDWMLQMAAASCSVGYKKRTLGGRYSSPTFVFLMCPDLSCVPRRYFSDCEAISRDMSVLWQAGDS